MTRTWIGVLTAAGLCLVITHNSVYASSNIKYGEWEVAINMLGMPFALPTQTQRVCLQKKNLAPGARDAYGCHVKWTLHTQSVEWTLLCRNGSHGNGSATYHWDRLKGYNELIMPGGFVSLRSTLTGRWVAASCSAQALR